MRGRQDDDGRNDVPVQVKPVLPFLKMMNSSRGNVLSFATVPPMIAACAVSLIGLPCVFGRRRTWSSPRWTGCAAVAAGVWAGTRPATSSANAPAAVASARMTQDVSRRPAASRPAVTFPGARLAAVRLYQAEWAIPGAKRCPALVEGESPHVDWAGVRARLGGRDNAPALTGLHPSWFGRSRLQVTSWA